MVSTGSRTLKEAIRKLGSDSRGFAMLPLAIILVSSSAVVLIAVNNHIDGVARANKNATAVQLTTEASARLKDSLARDGAMCSETFKAFRNFEAQAKEVRLDTKTLRGCLVTATEWDNLLQPTKDIPNPNFAIVTDQLRNNNSLSKRVKVSLQLTSKPTKNTFSKKVLIEKSFILQVPSLSSFNVVFKQPRSPLVQANGPSVIFTGSTWYSHQSPLRLNDITDTKNPTVIFQRPFLMRASTLLDSGAQAINLETMKKVFQGGIEHNVLNTNVVKPFLPDESFTWNHGIDQWPLYNDGSHFKYAVPQIESGNGIALCDEPQTAYQANRAAYTEIPNTNLISLDALGKTCEADEDAPRLLVHMKAGKPLSIRMKQSLTNNHQNNIFCGLVVASRLQVQLDGTGDYALFGNFAIDQLVVSGPAGATLYIHNPDNNIPHQVNLPRFQSQATLSAQIKTLNSGVALNFAAPFARNSKILPRPANFLLPQSCPNNATLKTFPDPEIPTKRIHELDGFVDLKNGSAQPLYILEETL